MSFDDQHYSERNPETLAYQDPSEVILTIWAALRPCREITGPDFNRSKNGWIEWIPPKKWNPDCGLRVYEPGRLFGRREFAQVVLNVIGDDYEISIWRKRHEGVVVFSTRDEGPILSPAARLKATVSKMSELVAKFDDWSRTETLQAKFPEEWLGKSANRMLQEYVGYRLLGSLFQGDSWRELLRAVFSGWIFDTNNSIESRTAQLAEQMHWSNSLALFVELFASVSMIFFAYVIAFFGGGLIILGVSSPSWFEFLFSILGLFVHLGAMTFIARHAVSLLRFSAGVVPRFLLASTLVLVTGLVYWGILGLFSAH